MRIKDTHKSRELRSADTHVRGERDEEGGANHGHPYSGLTSVGESNLANYGHPRIADE
jgi:hypothetical protein